MSCISEIQRKVSKKYVSAVTGRYLKLLLIYKRRPLCGVSIRPARKLLSSDSISPPHIMLPDGRKNKKTG